MNKKNKSTLALGNFDGLHLGHRKIIKKAFEVSQNGNVYVCSFEPHPLRVLTDNPPKILTPTEEKVRIIEQEFGAKYYAMKFDKKMAVLTGEEFIQKLLSQFDIDNVVVGANYYFGNKASYSTKDLKRLGREHSFNVYVVKELKIGGKVVSSTRIRQNLDSGNVSVAAKLLGREFCVSGTCSQGKGVGKSIGYATANLETEPFNQYPKQGVYATRTILDGKSYPSMTNVGYNPTVTKEHRRMIETNIFDFEEVLYGREICVQFVKRIRDEEKFSSLEELKNQLALDEKHARDILI
ncbi:MAG: bifunctional riboflavin kinase/FAD synthetase [Clostridia bacterium]|nr:bifunctional riboflavin kinase/FAD synthetase [Clostridia bacterium]